MAAQQQQAAQQAQLHPPSSARLAISSLCRVLRLHGVSSLEPETVRQAKFDGPVAAPMWRALHDVVLVVLAAYPDTAHVAEALGRQWSAVETLELASGVGEEGGVPAEGMALVIRQLAAWGAPPDLLRMLRPHPGVAGAPPGGGGAAKAPPGPRARPLLLALGWLVAAAGLFERRMGALEPGPQLRELLPPYPHDACSSPAVHAAYDSAVQDARDHVRRLPVARSSATPASAGRGRDPFGPPPERAAAEALWGDVEAAAQRAVTLCGRMRSRIAALQAATDCRHRLHHSLWARQAAASPSSRPLTPYELQLCAQQGAHMQRHMAALEAATLALVEQQELCAHGALFFEWLGSVLEEEEEAAGRQGGKGRQPRGGGGAAAAAAGDAHPGGRGGALASLEQLPDADGVAAQRLGAQLEAQLAAAVRAAEPELAGARRRVAAAGEAAASPYRPQPQQRAICMQSFLALAERAVASRPPPPPAVQPSSSCSTADGALSRGGGGHVHGAPQQQQRPHGGPLLLAGGPRLGDEGEEGGAGVWRLPDDIAHAVAAVLDAKAQRDALEAEELEAFQQLRYAALCRWDFASSGSSGSGGGVGVGGPLAAVLAAAAGTGGAGSGPGVAAADDTQRLLAAVLAVARPLARTRAAHKAALLGVLADLPEQYLVSGL